MARVHARMKHGLRAQLERLASTAPAVYESEDLVGGEAGTALSDRKSVV